MFVLGAVTATVAAGCNDRACVQWSTEEGACPSQQEALSFMPIRDCVAISQGLLDDENIVKSVDSEGTFDEDSCCYDVTFDDPDGCFDSGF